jgi:hypothetical protein
VPTARLQSLDVDEELGVASGPRSDRTHDVGADAPVIAAAFAAAIPETATPEATAAIAHRLVRFAYSIKDSIPGVSSQIFWPVAFTWVIAQESNRSSRGQSLALRMGCYLDIRIGSPRGMAITEDIQRRLSLIRLGGNTKESTDRNARECRHQNADSVAVSSPLRPMTARGRGESSPHKRNRPTHEYSVCWPITVRVGPESSALKSCFED